MFRNNLITDLQFSLEVCLLKQFVLTVAKTVAVITRQFERYPYMWDPIMSFYESVVNSGDC